MVDAKRKSVLGLVLVCSALLLSGRPSPCLALELPASAPLPLERPLVAGPNSDGQDGAPSKSASSPVQAAPQSELACREALRANGARFNEKTISAPASDCSLPFPLEVAAIDPQVDIIADVTINCTMALATSNFLRDVVQPAAKAILGAPVKSITQASGYLCRPRSGTTKLSEHAFGNALDIAAFTLATGEIVAVRPSPPAKHANFLNRVRSAACGPFKTVLGPGSDADHEFHFHFDLAQRRNAGTWCK